jgi:hypothetical protein
MENEFTTYQNLMKEATKYKKDDIDKAISIIRNAIEICPSCARFEGNFRLIKYLTIAKKYDEVQNAYYALLKGIDLKINSEPFNSYSSIYLSMSDYFIKEKNYFNAFYYSVLSYWNAVIRTAFAGEEKHLDYLLSNQYEYPVIQKLIKKFKNIDTVITLNGIRNVIRVYSIELKIIAKLYHKIQDSDKYLEPPYYENESYNFRLSRIMNDNSEYSQCVKVVKEINFESEYDIKIKPFL